MTDLRVLIIADDPLARAGLATLLAGQPGCTVVGRVAGDVGLPDEVEAYRPDVIMWDLGWNPTPALERLADLKEMELPIVTLLPDESHAAEARTAGARGLLLREADTPKLLAALSAVAQGLVTIDPTLTSALLSAGEADRATLAEALTPRELEVLQLLAEGLPNKTIAHQLNISEHTVKFHVNAILGKLGAQSRTEAVVRATRLGLILL